MAAFKDLSDLPPPAPPTSLLLSSLAHLAPATLFSLMILENARLSRLQGLCPAHPCTWDACPPGLSWVAPSCLLSLITNVTSSEGPFPLTP